MKFILHTFMYILLSDHLCHAQILKSIVYDFDGFDLQSSGLPEGDYSYGDLSYQIIAPPGGTTQVTGDRCLQLNINWNNGYAAFGRGVSRFLELSASQDRINFFFLNPVTNGQAAELELTILDDDDKSQAYEATNDDKWIHRLSISTASGWQYISVPLSNFADDNSGGNGIFDIGFTQDHGMLLVVEFRFNKTSQSNPSATYYMDFINFSEGAMPQGQSILHAPSPQPGDHCLVGAHQNEKPGEFFLIPIHFEQLFPPIENRRIKYVNTYMPWASNGSTSPHMLPGSGYTNLLQQGYTPVITWEPMFNGYAPLDPVQPSYSKILAGNYDQYLDDFGDALKKYSDTIIVRLMHEFDGDWYPWCISQNQQNPQLFIQTWKYIVDRVRNRGASKLKWMWCPNNDISPQESWNWIVTAYPGNSHVDIVATDVYNAHYPTSLPWWRSFRWQYAEVYYYLSRYFPSKPIFICELACRERSAAEPATSQTKAQWLEVMDKDMQSYFRKTRGLIFFNEDKSFNWSVNSSSDALHALSEHVWADDYYFYPLKPTSISEPTTFSGNFFYPNPAHNVLRVKEDIQTSILSLYTCSGKLLICTNNNTLNTEQLPPGIYIIEITDRSGKIYRDKVLKQ